MNNTQLRKLQEYLDLDDRGLLIKLPCRIDTRVYQIVCSDEKDFYGCCACLSLDNSDTDCKYIDDAGHCTLTGIHERVRDRRYRIISCRFKYDMIPYVGKTVFTDWRDAHNSFVNHEFAL